jgi:hypothetical protein
MLEYYIEKGANINLPPDNVGKLYIDHSKHSEYRISPFIVQAACHGNLDCFKTLIKHGLKYTE